MDERNDPLGTAVRKWAEEARSQAGEHPGAERLMAYAEDALDTAGAERLRDHLALCRECSRRVLELRAFPGHTTPDVPALSAAEVEREWQRLWRRVGHERGGLPTVRRRRVAATWAPWALAASLSIATLGLLAWGTSLDRRLADQLRPRGDAVLLEHLPTPGSRAPDQAVSRAGAPLVVVTDAPVPRDTTRFVWEVVPAAEGAAVLWRGPAERSSDGLFVLQLPGGFLAPGRYRLQLYGTEPRFRQQLAEIKVRIDE
ncbi:MAG TPA: zf-HC2 domain-containing protein [Thermoanaerobaculia bacterium]